MNWYKQALYSVKSKDGKEYFLSDWPKQKTLPDENQPATIKDKWIPVDSSFITHLAYFAPLRILEIKMRDEKEYSFSGVPKSTFTRFLKSKSKGEFFNRVIKPHYRTN